MTKLTPPAQILGFFELFYCLTNFEIKAVFFLSLVSQRITLK